MSFEVNGTYANRKGTYTVQAINGPKMTVRFDDGTVADLNIGIQERIWENIVAEREAKAASRTARRASAGGVNHFVKVISIAPGEELSFPGWEQRVVMALTEEDSKKVNKGDRLIYYALEAQTFFAVVTITGDPAEADPKKYTFVVDVDNAYFYPVDVDADAGRLEKGVTLDSIELESIPNFGHQKLNGEMFCTISEDDFELLAEALTEVSEDEDEEEDEDEDFEDDEDE